MTMMNELILQYYEGLSSSISRRLDIQGSNDTIFLFSNLSVPHDYNFLFSSCYLFAIILAG